MREEEEVIDGTVGRGGGVLAGKGEEGEEAAWRGERLFGTVRRKVVARNGEEGEEVAWNCEEGRFS